MPTVGRATEVNMNLLISISEEGLSLLFWEAFGIWHYLSASRPAPPWQVLVTLQRGWGREGYVIQKVRPDNLKIFQSVQKGDPKIVFSDIFLHALASKQENQEWPLHTLNNHRGQDRRKEQCRNTCRNFVFMMPEKDEMANKTTWSLIGEAIELWFKDICGTLKLTKPQAWASFQPPVMIRFLRIVVGYF